MMGTTASGVGRKDDVELEILTIPEVACFLRVPKSTIYKLVRRGGLPGQKIGKHWRFMREHIQSLMGAPLVQQKAVEAQVFRQKGPSETRKGDSDGNQRMSEF